MKKRKDTNIKKDLDMILVNINDHMNKPIFYGTGEKSIFTHKKVFIFNL